MTKLRISIEPSEFESRIGPGISIEFNFDEFSIYGYKSLSAVKEFCSTVGGSVAYTLACYVSKVKPNYETSRKIKVEEPTLPFEVVLRNGIYDLLMNSEDASRRPVEFSKQVASLCFECMQMPDAPVQKPQISGKSKSGSVVELPLRSFDFSP